jgi:hypothetical protein
MPEIEEAIQAIRMGDPDTGRQLLEGILENDESNPDVWLWLSTVVDNNDDREICLENVLALTPDNEVAKKGLKALKTDTFNIYTIFDELLEIEETAIPESTFIDDFVLADGSTDDDDLVLPSTMAKKPKSVRKKGGINLRIIILLGLILLIVLALAGSAVTYLFNNNGDNTDQTSPATAPTEQPESPPAVDNTTEPTPEPTATSEPTPTPEPTATPTNTPFQLPTPKPTDLPTPTATHVVPPTPG